MNHLNIKFLNPENEELKNCGQNDDKKSSLKMKSKKSVSSLNNSEIEFKNNNMRTESEQL